MICCHGGGSEEGCALHQGSVTFDEEEITDEILQNRLNEFTGKIDAMAKLYKKAGVLQEKYGTMSPEEAAEGSSSRAPESGPRHRACFPRGAQAGLHQQ